MKTILLLTTYYSNIMYFVAIKFIKMQICY
jgi:hypothetical protein